MESCDTAMPLNVSHPPTCKLLTTIALLTHLLFGGGFHFHVMLRAPSLHSWYRSPGERLPGYPQGAQQVVLQVRAHPREALLQLWKETGFRLGSKGKGA